MHGEKQSKLVEQRLHEQKEANDHMRASMETLSGAVESLTRRLQRHEESSSIRKRKRNVPVDIKVCEALRLHKFILSKTHHVYEVQ